MRSTTSREGGTPTEKPVLAARGGKKGLGSGPLEREACTFSCKLLGFLLEASPSRSRGDLATRGFGFSGGMGCLARRWLGTGGLLEGPVTPIPSNSREAEVRFPRSSWEAKPSSKKGPL
jgi:hypothetical protein